MTLTYFEWLIGCIGIIRSQNNARRRQYWLTHEKQEHTEKRRTSWRRYSASAKGLERQRRYAGTVDGMVSKMKRDARWRLGVLQARADVLSESLA